MFISRGSAAVLVYAFVLVTANISYEKECSENADHLKLFPHENCHQFYLCVDGKLSIRDCADGLLYNRETQTCDWPENVVCEKVKAFNIIENQNISPNTAGTKCSKVTDGILLAHENCNQFFICVAGIAVELFCTPGTYFDAQKQVCDWSFNVNCNGRLVLETDSAIGLRNVHLDSTNFDTSDALAGCAQADDGAMIAHENCDQYYMCLAGNPTALYCPLGLFFNPQKQVCDWSFNVDCNKIEDNSDAAVICAENPQDNIFIAHQMCTHFYVCRDGKSITLKCPTGLYFNSEKNVCDWPANVDCNRKT